MKKICLLFLFTILSVVTHAQINLVPNPSFEDTVSCPTMGGQVTKAKFWHSITNTPDYYHSCCIIPQFSVPNNTFGFQYPNSGNAYMGLYIYDLIDTTYREIIGAFLTSPLVPGIKYYVSFKTSFSAGIFQAVNIATNRIGVLFSTVDYLSASPPVNNFSQVYADTIIADSLNWTTVRGVFVADSAYSFISIGNFFQNYQTDTINMNAFNHTRGYYYLDDVCVSDDSMYCELWTGLASEIFTDHIKIYPNPVKDNLTVENIPWGCKAIEIYDINGHRVKEINTAMKFKTTINFSGLPQAMYSLVFKSNKSLISKKIIYSKN